MGSKSKQAGKDKGKEKCVKFPWNDDLVVKPLNCLKEYHRVNGYAQGFDWAVVNKEFHKLHCMELPRGVAKNKTEHMKKQWRNWVDLRFNVTGGGWDPVSGKVTMSEEWWDRQDKTSLDKYRIFRKRGVLPEISKLWDDVYANIVATGKNVMAPTMDETAARSLISAACEGAMDDEVVNCTGGGKAAVFHQLEPVVHVNDELRAIVARVRVDDELDDDDFLASIHDTLTTPLTEGCTGGNVSQQKDGTGGDISNGKKKRKRPSTTSISFNEHMAQVGQTGNRILSLLEGDVGSTSAANGVVERPYAFSECLDVLKRMVAANLIEDESEMWCIGVSKLAKEKNRNVFMSLESDSQRKVWLKFEMKMLRFEVPN